MLAKAEEIAREQGYDNMSVISGVGVRGYYEKWGYEKVGTYMMKEL